MPTPNFDEITAGAAVVLLCGVSGSGKTCLAHKLEAAGYVRLSADVMVWQRYGLDFSALPFERQSAIYRDIAAELDRELERLIRAGERVVVDATLCKRARRDALRALCARLGVTHRLVYLPATYEVLCGRVARRRGLGPDDQPVPLDRLRNFCLHFEPPAPEENALSLIHNA